MVGSLLALLSKLQGSSCLTHVGREGETNPPYDPKELEATVTFLADLSGESVSQRALAVGLGKHARSEKSASGSTAFVDGGYFATRGALRDSDDFGTAAILDTDIGAFKALVAANEPTDGLVLTIPKKYARRPEGAGLPLWLSVADGEKYDPWLGFVADDELALDNGERHG
jgi:hypothetical protein